MKLFLSTIDSCSGFKSISILSLKNGRSLFGINYGYISIFYRIFYTNFQLVDMGTLNHALDSCDLHSLTLQKIDDFLNEPLSFTQKIKYFFIINNSWVFSKERKNRLNIENNKNNYKVDF